MERYSKTITRWITTPTGRNIKVDAIYWSDGDYEVRTLYPVLREFQNKSKTSFVRRRIAAIKSQIAAWESRAIAIG